jgi:glycosyltransferase involved in cell wall biosynthesis
LNHKDKQCRFIYKKNNLTYDNIHSSSTMSSRPSISLCMIVKNQEEFLEKCLNSICNFVDEIIIVDTGSKDNTVAIAKKFTDKIYHHPWEKSFSKARNPDPNADHFSGTRTLYLLNNRSIVIVELCKGQEYLEGYSPTADTEDYIDLCMDMLRHPDRDQLTGEYFEHFKKIDIVDEIYPLIDRLG